MGINRRGQLSLDALVSFAALLAAFALLLLGAQRVSSGVQLSMQSAAERAALSYAALSLDTAASALAGAQFYGTGQFAVGDGGDKVLSQKSPEVSEPLLHRISSDSEGRLHVQSEGLEKI